MPPHYHRLAGFHKRIDTSGLIYVFLFAYPAGTLLGVQDDTQNLLGSGTAFWLIPRPTLPYIILNIIDGLIATLQHKLICLTCYCCVLTVVDYGSVLRGAMLHFTVHLRHLCVYWHIFHSPAMAKYHVT